MMHYRSTDVVVVGKGISALVLSILLKNKGIDHIVLDRVTMDKKPPMAETLPPSTLVLLESLGLKVLFENNSIKTFGYHSMWGSSAVIDTNFFFHNPYKYGLKIDKVTLLDGLEKEVEDKIFDFDNFLQMDTSDKGVCLKIRSKNSDITVQGKILVDATGRNRAVLKKLHIGTDHYDHLLAFTCHLPFKKHPELIYPVFVESFENGWGIVSALDKNTNVMTIFTQKGNVMLKQLKQYQHWETVLSKTRILKDFLTKDLSCKVVGSDANSSRASRISGSNWIAIGDAAISFDPLSSHGISNAVYGASISSEAIESYLENFSEKPLEDYAKAISLIFNEYLAHKSKLYAGEKRWQGSTFWNATEYMVNNRGSLHHSYGSLNINN